MEYFYKYINNYLSLKMDGYNFTNPIDGFTFSYGIRDGELDAKMKFPTPANTSIQLYNQFKLPVTFDPLKYGKLIRNQGKSYTVAVNKTSLAIIDKQGEYNKVEIWKNGDLVLKYTDRINLTNLENGMERVIGKNIYIYLPKGTTN